MHAGLHVVAVHAAAGGGNDAEVATAAGGDTGHRGAVAALGLLGVWRSQHVLPCTPVPLDNISKIPALLP